MSTRPDFLREAIESLSGSPIDYDLLLDLVGDARFVLLGEASHGTHEFYRERAQISKRLIVERGFNAVAVEADWPDAYRVNTFVRGAGEDTESVDALTGFKRFPQWMWRNADVLDFIGWLREHNDEKPSDVMKCGFCGLDPEAASRALHHYSCFDHFGRSTEAYGWGAGFGMAPTCEEEVVTELTALRRRAMEPARQL